MIAINTQNISAKLGGVEVLHHISAAIPQAQWTSIIGPNGAGKSTFLKVIAGLLPHTNSVNIFSIPLHTMQAKERAKKIAWLGQNEVISDDLLVYDLVMLGRLPHQQWFSSPSATDHHIVEQALRSTQAWNLRHRPINELSGGECQRILISRALAVQAEIILMDEPLANLDPPHQADLIDLIQSLTQQGTTVVTVLHDITYALQANHVIILNQGSLSYEGATTHQQTHAQIETVFSNRIKIHPLQGSWVVMPQNR
ncbi:ABC transporter ATP-binding protein [Polynucleobacter sp. IMCC30063]|uniref:ABC transporter ATP-binding protein n=1 Tax=Polynucleobacter sp. IMCC30063 TaxID=2907298 RepID=UPI001F2E0A4B|nr:ABC transporter ATP-binding protein [Polynucleobacter sp. IMCC30063]MCE7506778.1 ABC transporter ATP-binding protein [Polynucleobacter sp. IMCC30063]